MEKIIIKDKLAKFKDHWNPRIVGEMNGQHIKLVKFRGEFVWHKHDQEDEMFLVLQGEFDMEFRDKTIAIGEGEFIVVPKGTDHRPVAENEVHVMVIEPTGTLNTGDSKSSEFTRNNLEQL